MKLRRDVGLVGAGSVSQSFLARMPALLERLGPIKGVSFKVSRRIANALRGGSGVADFAPFESCNSIWITAPEPQLDSMIDELASAVRLQGKIVVVCQSLRNSRSFERLRLSGANIASLYCVPESGEQIFAGEGDSAAISEVRRILILNHRKLVELAQGGKPMFVYGIHIAQHMLLPWIAVAVESLRRAGFPRRQASDSVEMIGLRALRGYTKAGPNAFNSEEAQRLRSAIVKDFDKIRATDARLASMYQDCAALMLNFLDKRVSSQ